MEVQQNRSCLTQRPSALGCQKWMEINCADNAGPYLGAAGARPGPGVPAGSDRARAAGTGAPAIVHALPAALGPGSTRRESQEIRADRVRPSAAAQLRAVLFSPLSLWLFLDTLSPKIAVNATIAGLFMVSVATSSPAGAGTTQFIKHQPVTCSRAAAPLPRPSRDLSLRGSVGSVPPHPGLWHWGTLPSLQIQRLGFTSSSSMEQLLGFG